MAGCYACVYDSWMPAMEMLQSDGERGRMLMAIMRYHSMGESPDFSDDALLAMAWTFIKQDMDSNDANYTARVNAGKKGAAAKAKKDAGIIDASVDADNAAGGVDSDSSDNLATDTSEQAEAMVSGAETVSSKDDQWSRPPEQAEAMVSGAETLFSRQDQWSRLPPKEKEKEKEREKEREKDARAREPCDAPLGMPNSFVSRHNAEYMAIVLAWNKAGLARCTKTTLVTAGDDMARVRTFFDAYGGDAQKTAINAISNYAKIRGDKRYDIGYRKDYGFFGFLEKGVGFFVDSAKPFEHFAKKQSYGSGVSQSGCDAFTGDVPF